MSSNHQPAPASGKGMIAFVLGAIGVIGVAVVAVIVAAAALANAAGDPALLGGGILAGVLALACVVMFVHNVRFVRTAPAEPGSRVWGAMRSIALAILCVFAAMGLFFYSSYQRSSNGSAVALLVLALSLGALLANVLQAYGAAQRHREALR